MPKLNQKGFIAQLLLLLILLAGVGVGIYLVQTKTSLFSKAAPVIPQKPETSFELEAQAETTEPFADGPVKLTGVSVGTKFRVDVWARSDIDPANLFVARIKFPTDLLQVVEINKREGNSFVNQWITDPSFDNSSGNISIIGGVNAPGLMTSDGISYADVKGVFTSSVVFDSRTVYYNPDGSRTESITANGKYWNFNSANGWAPMDKNGSDLTTVDRYANGPCAGKSSCTFDTRNIFVQKDGKKIETITIDGKYWNFDSSTGWGAMSGNGSNLNSVDRYANGPCAGKSSCTFDTRTMYYETDGARIESITAYGKYWNFRSPVTGGWEVMSGSGSELTSVSRYANGPCSGQSSCTFETRTMVVNPDGSRTESITANGKYWNFNSANGWAAMEGNGSDLASVGRYAQIKPTPAPIVIVTNAPVPNPSTPVNNPSPTAATTITITTCNGQVKTWAEIDSELRRADYPGPFDHSQSEIDAYNRAACPSPTPGSSSIQTCLGSKTWDDIDNGLKKAKYGGPFDHGQEELDAFNRAACPSLSPNPTKSTLMMPRLMASIIFEVKKAGTAEISIDNSSEILRALDGQSIITARKGLTLNIIETPLISDSTCGVNALEVPPDPAGRPGNPLAVQFVYSAQYKMNNYVTAAQWDFDGDDKWDTDMSLFNGMIVHNFSKEGVYNPKLRLQMADGGITPVCSKKITVPLKVPTPTEIITQCSVITADAPLGKLASGESVYMLKDSDKAKLKVVSTNQYLKPVDEEGRASIPESKNGGLAITPEGGDGEIDLPATIYAINKTANDITVSVKGYIGKDKVKGQCPEAKFVIQPNKLYGLPPAPVLIEKAKLRHDGDINSDGKINLVDMSRLLAQIGQKSASEADLNSDEMVNVMDVLQLRSILVKNGILGKK